MSQTNNSISIISKGGKQWFQSEMEVVNKSVSFETMGNLKNVKIRDSAKGVPSIKYPIFVEASKLTKDKLWSSIMMDAAVGIFPRRFTFNEGILIHKNKNKQINERINMEDPQECFNITKNFLQTKGNIYSEFDESDIVKSTDKTDDEIMVWSHIKSNPHKQILIAEFIKKIKNYFELNDANVLDLEQTINLGILAGYFDASSIKLENGTIAAIDGLFRNVDGRFLINIDNQKIKIKKKTKESELTTLMSTIGMEPDFFDKNGSTISINKKIIFLKIWIKFLNSLEKKLVKFTSE